MILADTCRHKNPKELDHTEIVRAGITALQVLRDIGMQTFIESFSSQNTEENMRMYLGEKFSDESMTFELCNPGSLFFIAKNDGKTVGYLKLNTGNAQTDIADKHTMEIERIYVLQSMHGKRVGHSLLQTAIDEAQKTGVEFLWLGVWEHNEKAIQFYRKHGFEPFGTHVFMLGNDAQTDLLMKLHI